MVHSSDESNEPHGFSFVLAAEELLGVCGDSSCGRAELLRRGKIRGMLLNVPGRDGVGVFTLGGVDAPAVVGVVGVSSMGESGSESLRSTAGGGT